MYNQLDHNQLDHNSHVEAWLLHQIKVAGPNYYGGVLCYQAKVSKEDIGYCYSYGHSPEEAKSELMASLGY